jgi:Flp pilus assembly protein TadD
MLAIHARSMAVSTAEQLAQRRPEDNFATALMVNVAVDLAQSHASGAARDLLQQVLRLDPDCTPALLSLGFSYERAAEHNQAATAYRQLTEVDPGLAEGRLRLAINLVRTGREKEGESMFLDLLSGEPPAWIKRLAAEELVRLLKRTERLSAAEGMARDALAAMPDDQRLWILLAAILDDLERYQESLDAMRDLPPATRGVSPRARYAEWPDLGPAASPQHLVERARASRSALGSALAAIGGS